jgi:predicted transcriptional regulator of viral defense system
MGVESAARREGRQRKALAKRERELLALAQRQHGVLSREQLLAGGLSKRTISRRVESGRLHPIHRGVYMLGGGRITRRGEWMAAVRACGEGALLSHRSAAALWALTRDRRSGPIEVSAARSRNRPGIVVREGGVHKDDRAVIAGIPVTSVARTLFDCAELEDERRLERMFEEADRLGILEMRRLDEVCARGYGRHALRTVRGLMEQAHSPIWTRSELELQFAEFCREWKLPPHETNVDVLGNEVDALWPRERLVVELDSWEFHRHRNAFESDRAKDVARQVAGYRAIRVTGRRLEREREALAIEIRSLLAPPAGGRAAV